MKKNRSKGQEPMTDDDLEAALGTYITSSTGYTEDHMTTLRAELLSSYLRLGYTDDAIARQEDRSDVVDSTCADTVDNILGELIETLMGAEQIANFIPNGPDDAEAANQETLAVHNIVFTRNPGYLIFHNWLWDGLTTINGYVKAWYDERQVVDVVTYTGQDNESMGIVIADLESDGATVEVLESHLEQNRTLVTPEQLEQSDNLKLEAAEADSLEVVEETGQIAIVTSSTSFKLRVSRKKGSYKIAPIPTDEILISSMWKSVDLTDCPFVGHRYATTESDLIARGFDREEVENLPTAEGHKGTAEGLTRFDGFENMGGVDPGDDASREIEVIECWFKIDRDGDGISELVMATVSGADNSLLHYSDGSVAVDQMEEMPVHAWTPFIVPHRHHGQSVVERNRQIQRSKTLLQRQLSDSVAFSGNPRMVLGKDGIGPDTIADSMVFRPGGIIRAKDASQVQPVKLPSSAGDIMPVLDYWSDRNEERTGATRLNQGLVADKFGKQVAGITIAQLRQAGMAKINMIARNFLETGFASLMRHLHAMLRRHQSKELHFQVRGEWVSVDPTNWGERSEIEAGLGLGTQGRMVKAEALRDVISNQRAAIENGSVLADEKHVYNALSDLSSVTGLRDPSRYFVDPASVPPVPEEEPEGATPEQVLAEAQLEIARQEANTRQQSLIQKENDDARQAELKRQELALKEKQIQLEDDFKRDQAALKAAQEVGKRDQGALRASIEAPKANGSA